MKKFTRIISVLIFLASSFVFVNGQGKKISVNENVNNISNRIKVETKNKEVSFSIPDNYTFYEDKEEYKYITNGINKRFVVIKNTRSIITYEKGVSIWLNVYDVSNGEKTFKYFPFYKTGKSDKATDYKIGQNNLREIVFQDENRLTYNYYFYSENRFYNLGIGTRKTNNISIKSFLNSFIFNGINFFASDADKVSEADTSLILEDMKSTPIEVFYNKNLETEDEKDKDNTSDKSKVEDSNESLILLSKPKPGYTSLARQKNEQGFVKLKVEFGENGLVRKVTVIKNMKYGLTEKAIDAARGIKFLPPEKDGIPYSVTKVVQYNFSIY